MAVNAPHLPLSLASLYVGDLDPAVGESDLAAAFTGSGVGPSSARVCRDRVTGASLCYAYLNFSSFAMAERAMAVMNHRSLKGRPMRIMWSLRDPMARRTGVGNLFVKNLEVWIGGSELEELFKEYGFVVSCKVALDENGNSKGFGFVQMGNEEGAQSAIKNLHGKVLDGGTKGLYVSNFVKKSQREALSPQSQKYTNLYIKNLEADFTDDLLRAKFSEFGDVASAVIMKDELGKSRGFGFVTLKGFNQAMKAMDALNGSMLGSKKIYVGFAQKKALREEILKQHLSEKKSGEDCTKKVQGTNVYVKYLAASVDDKTLKGYFSICGEVVSAKVMQYPNGISKGFGFVSYSSPEEATKAVTTLHGALFHGNSIYVAMAQRKEERQKVLQIQFAKIMAQSTSYSRPVVYPLPHYWQPRNYVHYQGYKYLYPVTVPVYYRQQSAYPQYAASASSQMQNSVHLPALPRYAASASSQLQNSAHPVYPVKSIRSVQPTRSNERNRGRGESFNPHRVPARAVRI